MDTQTQVPPLLVLALAVALVAGLALGYRGLQGGATGAVEAGPLFVTVEGPLYAPNDPWRSYLADERTCPGGEDAGAPLAAQAETMVCLINYARAHAGLPALAVSTELSHAAQLKSEQIVRCRNFSHEPCGGAANQVALDAGYDGAFGENLYIAQGRQGAPRPALDGWLNSQPHRENLLLDRWRVQSLYVVKLDRFDEYSGATLWVSHFGDR